jgi:hypothetical protein
MAERISVAIELEFFNKFLFNALKRSLYNATPKRKLEIIYYYSRDPRVKFSINMTGYSIPQSQDVTKWSSVFSNVQTMRSFLR